MLLSPAGDGGVFNSAAKVAACGGASGGEGESRSAWPGIDRHACRAAALPVASSVAVRVLWLAVALWAPEVPVCPELAWASAAAA